MTEIRIATAARPRRRGLLYVLVLLLVIVAGASLWTWLTLSWAYADGTRAGVLQKVTRRGWFCKTIEGDLAQYIVPGISPQVWKFSIRDPLVAAQLEKIVGRQVQLHYTEHPGVPSACFADTRFFVDNVTVTDGAHAAGPTATPSGTAPAAATPPGAAIPPAATPPSAAAPGSTATPAPAGANP
jgi:hypothetical protein